ncbi:MAG: hypothetical protein HC836_10695 [Richelia sp. RM2_1_2]|nr:hypothetical protein [Richelia sp. RM2_1_2]
MTKHYLERADARTVAQACERYGMVAFMDEELTTNKVATIAANAITELYRNVTELSQFFTTSVTHDDSYESIRYEIDDQNPTMSVVVVRRVITYKPCGASPQRITITHGPCIPRDGAKAFVQNLNAIFADRLG